MEGLRDSGEDNTDRKESPGRKKKRAETLGTFLIDPKTEHANNLSAETVRPKPEQRRAKERIGHVLIDAETPKASGPEKPKTDSDIEKQVAGLGRTELLELSEKIAVEATTLRNIYDTHLIGERGLRRLVTEYLEGHDIKELLTRELLERELDFERDPALRDAAPQDVGGSTTTLQGLLQKADDLSVDLAKEELAVLKARGEYESSQQQRSQQRRRLADISLISIIIILVALVVALAATRH